MSKADRTRAFIIEQTAGVFNTRGFAGTSLQDMSDATGLSKGSIYSNFKNKDEVALAVFEFNWKRLNNLIAASMEGQSGTLDKLLVYSGIFERILLDPILHAGCPILNTAIESDDTHPLLRAKAGEAMGLWKERLRKQIRQGIDAKELKKDLDPGETAFAIIAMIEGSIMLSKLSGKIGDRQRARHSIEKFIKNLQA